LGNARFFDLGTNPKDLEQNQRLSQKTGKTMAPNPTRNPASLGSATEDYLENVAVGSETILNAAEYKFYGFYERIREKLSYRWNQELRRQFESWFAQGRAVSGTRTTQLEVLMSAAGHIEAIRVLGSAGIEALDRAAIVAFQKAGPYPNPPKALVEEGQGKVKVRWDFVVVADAHQGVRVDIIRRPSSL
jgi:protein TonB